MNNNYFRLTAYYPVKVEKADGVISINGRYYKTFR